jgi:hypothetical protein
MEVDTLEQEAVLLCDTDQDQDQDVEMLLDEAASIAVGSNHNRTASLWSNPFPHRFNKGHSSRRTSSGMQPSPDIVDHVHSQASRAMQNSKHTPSSLVSAQSWYS